MTDRPDDFFTRASRILSMDILGMPDWDLTDDDRLCAIDEADLPANWPTDEDARGQDHLLAIWFDAESETELAYIVTAITKFVERRTTASNVRVELT